MRLLPENISLREKLILAGLYLAKYDEAGLKQLGFNSFVEAFNVIGYGLGARPASIKNYRDEFDSLFPNNRKKAGTNDRLATTASECLRNTKPSTSLRSPGS